MPRSNDDSFTSIFKSLLKKLRVSFSEHRMATESEFDSWLKRGRGTSDSNAHGVEEERDLRRKIDCDSQTPRRLEISRCQVRLVAERLRHLENSFPCNRANARTGVKGAINSANGNAKSLGDILDTRLPND
jgi:hypothetical protein